MMLEWSTILCDEGISLFGSELAGKAFENWIAHEVRSHNEYAD
jgi:hypothetical protein